MGRTGSRASTRYLVGGLLLTGVWYLLPSGGEVRAVLWPLVNLTAALAVGVAMWRWPSRRTPAWLLLLAGLILYTLGDISFLTKPVLQHRDAPFPSTADAMYVGAYLCFIAGLIVLLRTRSPRVDRANLIDTSIISVGIGLLMWAFFMAPYAHDATLPYAARAVSLAYPALDVLLFAGMARLTVGGTRGSLALRLILGFAAAQLVCDLLYSIAVLDGTFTLGSPVLGGYCVTWVMLGAAALHPSADAIGETIAEDEGGRSTRRLALLAVAALIAPAILLILGSMHDYDEIPVVAAGSAVMFVLVLVRVRGLMVSVEQHRQVAERLSEAEERYRVLLENIPAVTYVDLYHDEDPLRATSLHIGPQVEDLFGYSREEWMSSSHDPWENLVHPDDIDRVYEEGARAAAEGVHFRSEYRVRTKDGRIRWVHEEAAIEQDHAAGTQLWRGVMFDITERKHAQEELERSLGDLRRLSVERALLLSRLVDAQEAERERIAEEIHDDPLQQLTAVGLRLNGLRRQVGPETVSSIDSIEETVHATIGRLRNLMFELRPRALDTGGLAEALRDYLHVVRDEGGPDFRLTNNLSGEPSLQTRTVAYRIAQEALNNVRKHAAATRVEVSLETREGGVHVVVQDDGAGAEPAAVRSSPRGHLGITTMRERTDMSGGWFRIESVPGRGTRVEFWLPDVRVPADLDGIDAGLAGT